MFEISLTYFYIIFTVIQTILVVHQLQRLFSLGILIIFGNLVPSRRVVFLLSYISRLYYALINVSFKCMQHMEKQGRDATVLTG